MFSTTPIEIKTVNKNPTLAANFFGPAFTMCTGTLPAFNPNFMDVQIGLYFTPKNMRIIKSNADMKITSLKGVNKNMLITEKVKIEYILVNLEFTLSVDIGHACDLFPILFMLEIVFY